MENVEGSRETLELICFRIEEQEFCLDIMAVREIRGWTAATALPHAPSYVCGMINLRGTVLPILDLKARLGLGSAEPTARSAIIVVHIGRGLAGLLVDGVSEILAVKRAFIQPTPSTGCDTVNRFVQGIVTIDGRMISWLAIEDILPGVEDAESA